ncbi:MAG: hypothetical protein ACJAT2_000061 [Bacteriovoracaceae bacterium]|jgi:hypothetical protein
MKSINLLTTAVLFSSLAFGVTAKELPKNCHMVKPIVPSACLQKHRNTNGKEERCQMPKGKIVCDKVEKKEELLALIEAQEEKRIFKCLKSIATNKKSMGIIPVGEESEKKFEIKDHSLMADQAKKEHIFVDAKSKRVQKCKFNGKNKVCSRATWSHLKKVLKDNIALSKVDPFKPIKEKFEKKKIDLNEKKSDYESKESFINSMAEADGEGIKKYLDSLESSNSENAIKEKKKWKKIFAKKLGVKESDFSKLEKLKAVKKDKIAKALKELKEETKKKIADLPQDELSDKVLYKQKLEKVSESAKNGKKLCQDIGLEGLVTEIKKKSGSQSGADASRSAASNTK